VNRDSPWPALGTAPRILVSALVFIALLQLGMHDFTLSTLLFYSNFIDPHAGHGASFWFINMLLQLYLIAFALCSIPAARSALRDHPIASSLTVLGAAVLTAKLVPHVWDTGYLYNLVPHYMGWLFAAGACLYYASAPKWRPVASVMLLVFAWKLVPMDSVRAWVTAGGLMLIWLAQIQVPQWLARGLSTIASASLYVYLTHVTVFHALRALIPNVSHAVEIVVAFGVGIAVWQLFDRAWDYTVSRSARRTA
ncbi:MAG TPA: acyltransferase family protein, partial [Polyangiales bacterium]